MVGYDGLRHIGHMERIREPHPLRAREAPYERPRATLRERSVSARR